MFKLSLFILFFSLEASALDINWYNRYITRDTKSSFANPNNKVAEMPKDSFESDLRTSYSWQTKYHKFKFDPRFIYISNPQAFRYVTHGLQDNDIFLNEAFYQLTLNRHQVVTGLQNYQWGPAELLSPSNPIFRFLPEQRSLFFQQRGKNLVRWNWSINRQWTLVSMVEVSKNGVGLPREDQHFTPNGLIKLERGFRSASDYIGVVSGITPSEEYFVGEYGAVGLTKELSIYMDARHQYESNNFYPGKNATDRYRKSRSDTQDVYSIATAGIRHEARVDVRLEYIYNGLGMNEKEWKTAKNSLQTLSLNLPQNFKRFYLSGRELNKQHYGYLSVRIPDLGYNSQYTVFLRHFNSLQDVSNMSQLQIDRLTGDAFNLYLEAATYQGPRDSDFSSVLSHEVSAGFRWSH